MLHKRPFLCLFFFFATVLGVLTTQRAASSAQLTLTWLDNSTDETGFNIERRIGTTASYQQLASVGANVTSYADLNLSSSTTYCYRVYAFNSAGISPYSPEACAATPAITTTNTISTNIANAAVLSGSSVVWTATPTGSPLRVEFLIDSTLSWTDVSAPYRYNGDAGILNTTTLSNGSHQLTVRAVYSDNSTAVQSVTVTVSNASSFTLTVLKAGTGAGTVTSSPAGINCGTTCSAAFNSATAVTLTATPVSGSSFAGWSGNADCTDGSVTMNSTMSCTATFNLTPGYKLSTSVVNEVTSSGSAGGRIVSNPVGIDCGTDCSETYTSGKIVILTPVPATNSKFAGWTGDADCSDGSVTMNANKTCTAKFAINAVTLSVSKNGNGTVMSTPSGVTCGTTCSNSFAAGATVSLRATPDAGFVFAGWSGGCTGT